MKFANGAACESPELQVHDALRIRYLDTLAVDRHEFAVRQARADRDTPAGGRCASR